jgi:hypothetical protein
MSTGDRQRADEGQKIIACPIARTRQAGAAWRRALRAAKHPFEAKVVVDVRPVDTAAVASQLPPTSLFRRGMIQQRVPPQRRHDLAAVLKRYDQVLVGAVNVGDLKRSVVNHQNAHAMPLSKAGVGCEIGPYRLNRILYTEQNINGQAAIVPDSYGLRRIGP